MTEQRWKGDTPVVLIIESDEGAVVGVDLDEHQWASSYAAWLRVPGLWTLASKDGVPRLRVVVKAGEQPYYTARHVGVAGSGGSNEITAYGIGKKFPDGSVMRLWLMPDGTVCGAEDVDTLGIAEVHRRGPRIEG